MAVIVYAKSKKDKENWYKDMIEYILKPRFGKENYK